MQQLDARAGLAVVEICVNWVEKKREGKENKRGCKYGYRSDRTQRRKRRREGERRKVPSSSTGV